MGDLPSELLNDLGALEAPSPEAWPEIRERLLLRYRELADVRADLARLRVDVGNARRSAMVASSSERGRAQFIANLSHELRTPLNAILGYADLVTDELQDRGEPSLVADVGRISRAGRALLGLIDDLIDLARIDAGRMALVPEECDVATLVEEAVAQLAASRGVPALHVVLEGDGGAMVLDAARLRQCLEVLIQRAVEVGAAEPVRVRLQRDGGLLTVRVHDAGVLGPEEQASAFSEFANVRRDGAGLGLVLTRRLVERMGGSLEVVSGASGTTFTLRIADTAAASSATAEALARKAMAAVPCDPRAVLLIDDDPDMQDLLGRVLGGAGYRVLGAMDGEQGLAVARRVVPRAIVLDLVLPGLSGWDVLARVKADPALAQVPVVVLSTVDDRARGLAAGAAACFVKPVEREALLATFRRLAPTDAFGAAAEPLDT